MARYVKSQVVIPIVLLLILWRLLIIQINAPWFGHHDANGVWLSAVARNFRTYGILELGPIPVMNRGPIPPEVALRYVHHPPLVPWLVTLAQLLFGDHEMAARLVSILGTMIGASAFYVLCRRLYDRQQAVLCFIFYAFSPMVIFFGRMPDHEPLSMAFLLLFLAVFVNWSRQPTRQRWWLMILMAVLAIWSAWAPFFFVALVGVFGWWKGAAAQRRSMVFLVIVGVLAVVSVVAIYQLFFADSLTQLLQTFLWRTSTVSEISQDFTLLEFIGQQFVHLVPYATIAVLVLALVGIVPTIRRACGSDQALLLALGLAGVVYVFVFRSASYVHDYYKIYMMPFLAIAAANAVSLALSKPRVRRFAQPALVGLIIVSSGFAILYLRGLYTASFADETLGFAQNIADHSAPEEIVLSNFPQANPVIEYYAHRYVVWNVQPAHAEIAAEASAYPSVYVYCGADTDEIALLPTGKLTVESDGCQFIHFDSK